VSEKPKTDEQAYWNRRLAREGLKTIKSKQVFNRRRRPKKAR